MVEALVYIIDNSPGMLDALSWIIGSVGLKVKTFSSPHSFLETFDPLQPGCLLLDVRMPMMNGSELQEKLKTMKTLTPPIIFISGHDDVALAVRAMKEGAVDFMVKPLNEQIFLEAINRALHIDKIRRARFREISQARAKFFLLSAREKQILQGIVEGKSNKVIALEINLSLKTVEAHRASLMKKLSIKTVSELVKLFLYLESACCY